MAFGVSLIVNYILRAEQFGEWLLCEGERVMVSVALMLFSAVGLFFCGGPPDMPVTAQTAAFRICGWMCVCTALILWQMRPKQSS